MMVGLPGASEDRVPADTWAIRAGRGGVPRGPGERRRAAGAAAGEHGTAPEAGRIRYKPADRAWFAALAPFLPRRRWAGIFPLTPAMLPAWHCRPKPLSNGHNDPVMLAVTLLYPAQGACYPTMKKIIETIQ